VAEQDAEPSCEGVWFSKRQEAAVELKGALESGDKLAAEDTLSTLKGRKKERREEIQRK